VNAEDAARKRFDKARKEVKDRYGEISQDTDKRIKELLEKTYKQFEKTYDVNSRSS